METRAGHDCLVLGGGEGHQTHGVAQSLYGMQQLEVFEVIH